MYGSYYLIHLSLEGLIADKPSLLHFKVTSPYFIMVEDFAKDRLLPAVRSELGAEYYLMAIEKNYAYSSAEMEMGGAVDFALDGDVKISDYEISNAIAWEAECQKDPAKRVDGPRSRAV